jgi:hypothetical protein
LVCIHLFSRPSFLVFGSNYQSRIDDKHDLDVSLNAPADIQNQFDDLLDSDEIFQFIDHLRVSDPLRLSLSKIGLRADQLIRLDLLIDGEDFLQELTFNRGMDKANIHVMMAAAQLRRTGPETPKSPTGVDMLLSTNRSVFHVASSVIVLPSLVSTVGPSFQPPDVQPPGVTIKTKKKNLTKAQVRKKKAQVAYQMRSEAAQKKVITQQIKKRGVEKSMKLEKVKAKEDANSVANSAPKLVCISFTLLSIANLFPSLSLSHSHFSPNSLFIQLRLSHICPVVCLQRQ